MNLGFYTLKTDNFFRKKKAKPLPASPNFFKLFLSEFYMLLSDKRAKAVADYMSALGIGAERVEIIPRGEAGAAMDVAKTSPEAKHDRRVDIVKFR